MLPRCWQRRAAWTGLLAAVVSAHIVTLRGAAGPAGPALPRPTRVAAVVTLRPGGSPASRGAPPARLQPGAVAPPAGPALAPDDRHAPYWPPQALDWPALPRSAPDATRLDGQELSGLPLTLRLYIDARGVVTEVQALSVADVDRPALPALRSMFVATAYSPGRRQGHDVASYVDLSLGIEALPPAEATGSEAAPVSPM